MSKRGRRGNGHARHAQLEADPQENEADDGIVVVDEGGNEVLEAANEVDSHQSDHEEKSSDGDEFSSLQRQFDELKAAREADAVKLREYEQRSVAQAQDVQASQKALIEHALLTAKGELSSAKTAFKEAMQGGDFDAATDAQAAIAAAQLDARQYELARDDFDRQIESAKHQPKRQSVNREEQINSYMDQFTPTTRAWAEKHRDDLFKSDARVNQAVALHHAAVNGGISPDTTEYFEYVERGLGIKSDAGKPQRMQQERRPPMASAPVSRGNSSPGSRIEVQLTQAQRDMAARLGMTSQKYAKYVDEIQKNQNKADWRGPRFSSSDGQPKA